MRVSGVWSRFEYECAFRLQGAVALAATQGGASLVRNAPDLILPWPDDDPSGGGGLTWAGYAGTWREQGAAFRGSPAATSKM